jgi:predicted RNA binding protein YcfA (HicA-like mRNA interferase family)
LPKLPVLTPKKLIKILEQQGFYLDHSTGSHKVYYHPQKKRRVTVPFHRKDLPKGTLISMLRQAGIEKDNLD